MYVINYACYFKCNRNREKHCDCL